MAIGHALTQRSGEDDAEEMTFQPAANSVFEIDGLSYRVAEHPAAPGVAYGQEGRAGIVYQLLGPDGDARALKVFKPRFRAPGLVSLSGKLEAFADSPGLQVCRRTMLAPQRHAALLRAHPDLTYAVIMPWVSGPTWMEVLLDEKRALTADQSLRLARGLAEVLSLMEQNHVAHCDLSAPNVIITQGEPGVALVDVEQMFGPDLRRPDILPAGSAGYAHKTAPEGLWSAQADRFAGAVMLAEMLGLCDERIRHSVGESFFASEEVQKDSDRYRRLATVLYERWGEPVAQLFERAWQSETLDDCATFGEWVVALPESVPVHSVIAPSPAYDDTKVAVRVLTTLARQFEAQDNHSSAAQVYEQLVALIPSDSSVRGEVMHALQEAERRAAAAPTSTDTLASLFDDGLDAYLKGQRSRARELWSSVVVRQSDYVRAGQTAAALLALVEQQMVNLPTPTVALRLPQPSQALLGVGLVGAGLAMLGLSLFWRFVPIYYDLELGWFIAIGAMVIAVGVGMGFSRQEKAMQVGAALAGAGLVLIGESLYVLNVMIRDFAPFYLTGFALGAIGAAFAKGSVE